VPKITQLPHYNFRSIVKQQANHYRST